MSKNDNQHETKPSFVFEKKNYFLMLIGLALMALGYILMIGGKSNDPNVFNEAIFNTQRITIAPLLILAGIVVEIVAILYKPKAANDE